MKRKICETIGGLAFIGISILLAFITIGNTFLLIISGVIFLSGMSILFHAGRIDTDKMKFKELTVAGEGNILDRNNKIINEWNNINSKRDKLKMVTIAGDNTSQTGQ